MTLAVIGAGFGRTGTASLKLALEHLGLGPCHHMEEVLKSPAQLAHWQAIAAGHKPDWNQVFAGFGSMVDWPGANYWRELADFYPNAKVLLSVRPEEAWWKSFSQTNQVVVRERAHIPGPHIQAAMEMGEAIVNQQTFNGATDKPSILSAYRRRIEEVRAAIPPERLLVFNVAEGWAPLCRFLGQDLPAIPFPRTNNTEEFWQHVRGGGPA